MAALVDEQQRKDPLSPRGMHQYALSQDEASEWLSNDERILELSAKLDHAAQEKVVLMKRHEVIENNLESVHQFLGHEKDAITKIMDGARKKIAAEREMRELAEQELELERERSAHMVEELAIERERSIVVKQALTETQSKYQALKAILVRQQVRALYHILCNIEYQRHMHYFSLWRKFTADSQTLRAAEDLRRMTERSSPSLRHEESDVDVYRIVQSEPDLSPLDVDSLDIYALGADMGLITHQEAKQLSPGTAPRLSRTEMAALDADGSGTIDAHEWHKMISTTRAVPQY